jgi:hypothetical protein
MKSLLREILANRPVAKRIHFGIQENVRLVKIDNDDRMKDGQVTSRNTYLHFEQFKINDEGEEKVFASSVFSFFDIDPTKEEDKIIGTIASQIEQLQSIVNCYNPEVVLDPISDYSDMDELLEDLKTKKGSTAIVNKLYTQFEEAVSDYIGKKSDFVRLKVSVSSNGQHLQLPYDGPVLEKQVEGKEPEILSFTSYEKKCISKYGSDATARADSKGSAPSKSLASI